MAAKSKEVDQTKVVTTASGVRIETPKSDRGKKPNVAVTVVHDMNPASGFVPWLRQNAVIGLAVGFVVGTQMQVVVKQFIDGFVTPLFLLFSGSSEQPLNKRVWVWHLGDNTPQTIYWGAIVYTIINFVFVLLILYIVIKFLKLDKFDQPKKKGE